MVSLKTLISNLTAQVTNLDTKIKELTISAHNALNSKNRILALSSLRSKKLAERNLQQRSDTLFQLEEIYAKIEQAADQVDIIQVMQASTGVLRGLNEQVGGIEKVEDVVEKLRKEMANVDEVGTIMNEAAPVIDEGELDDELEAMEEQEKEAQREKEAETIRQKLAELDRLRVLGPEERAEVEKLQSAAKVPSTVTSAELEESIDKLSQMSIADNDSTKDGPTKVAAE